MFSLMVFNIQKARLRDFTRTFLLVNSLRGRTRPFNDQNRPVLAGVKCYCALVPLWSTIPNIYCFWARWFYTKANQNKGFQTIFLSLTSGRGHYAIILVRRCRYWSIPYSMIVGKYLIIFLRMGVLIYALVLRHPLACTLHLQLFIT